MPASMCSSMWQWNIQVPALSGTMSAVTNCVGEAMQSGSTSWRNGITDRHARGIVKRNVAVKQPNPGIVWHHVRGYHLHRLHSRHIRAHLIDDDGIAVPMWGVYVEVIRSAEEVPTNMVALAHCERAKRHAAVRKT